MANNKLTKKTIDFEINKIRKIINANNIDEINLIVPTLHVLIRDYFIKNWSKILPQFVENLMPLKKLGLRTSNRVESYFGKLKKFTNTRQKTTNFIDDLNKFHL